MKTAPKPGEKEQPRLKLKQKISLELRISKVAMPLGCTNNRYIHVFLTFSPDFRGSEFTPDAAAVTEATAAGRAEGCDFIPEEETAVDPLPGVNDNKFEVF